MNLAEVGTRMCKVGRTSITVCDEHGKTCGVVRNVEVMGKEVQANKLWLKYEGEYVFALDADTHEFCKNWVAEHGDMYGRVEVQKLENFSTAMQALEAAGVKYVWLHTQQRYGYQGT